MAIRQIELPAHNRFGWEPMREQEEVVEILGRCECGCREHIDTAHEYIEWDGMYFVDRGHVIDYLKKFDNLREVG